MIDTKIGNFNIVAMNRLFKERCPFWYRSTGYLCLTFPTFWISFAHSRKESTND